MDFGEIGDVERVAARLDGCAEAVDRVARRARTVVEAEWRGEAAEAFELRVLGHHADLVDLAGRVRGAARLVRDLGGAAHERLAVVEDLLPGPGGWP